MYLRLPRHLHPRISFPHQSLNISRSGEDLPLLLFPHKLVGNVQIAVEIESGGMVVVPSIGSDTERLPMVASLRDAFYRGWRRTPDCTPLRYVCQGLLRLRFSETRDKCGAVSANRRLANGGVKKSGGASVKNGELSEDERNEMKLIKFFAV